MNTKLPNWFLAGILCIASIVILSLCGFSWDLFLIGVGIAVLLFPWVPALVLVGFVWIILRNSKDSEE